MMHLPRFEHLRPASVEEAIRILEEYGPRSRLVAGGTDLYPRLKYGLLHPEVVVSLKGVSVNPPVMAETGDLHLDALMTLAEVVCSPLVKEVAPLLAEAGLSVASNQIRHMGTLGGNLCLETRCAYYNQSHTFQFIEPCFKLNGDRCYLIPKGKRCQAVFMADTVPAMICLDARVEVKGPGDNRVLSVEELYTGDSLCPIALSESEIVTKISIPSSSAIRGSAFTKFSLRGGLEFGALTVAVLLDMGIQGKYCEEARITVGAVSGKPLRAHKAEASVKGRGLSEGLFRGAAEEVAAEIRPILHHDYSIPFLKECLRVEAFRTLSRAARNIVER